MVENVREDVCLLHAMWHHLIFEMSIHRFWHPWGFWKQSPTTIEKCIHIHMELSGSISMSENIKNISEPHVLFLDFFKKFILLSFGSLGLNNSSVYLIWIYVPTFFCLLFQMSIIGSCIVLQRLRHFKTIWWSRLSVVLCTV